MPKEELSDVAAAIRAIRLRAMLDRKRLRHLGDPDAPEAADEAGDDPNAADQPPEADSAS